MNETVATPNYWLIGAGLLLAFLATIAYGWISWKVAKPPINQTKKGLIGGIVLGLGSAICGMTFISAWSAFVLWPLAVFFGLVMGVLGLAGIWSPSVLVRALTRNVQDKK